MPDDLWQLALQNRTIVSNLVFLFSVKKNTVTEEFDYNRFPVGARRAIQRNITTLDPMQRLQKMAPIAFVNELSDAFWIDAFHDITQENALSFLTVILEKPETEKLGFTFWKALCDKLSGENYIHFSQIILKSPVTTPLFIPCIKAILLHAESCKIPEKDWVVDWNRGWKWQSSTMDSILDILSHKDARHIPPLFWKSIISHDCEQVALSTMSIKLLDQQNIDITTSILITFWSEVDKQRKQHHFSSLAHFLSQRTPKTLITKDFCKFLLNEWCVEEIADVIVNIENSDTPNAPLFYDTIYNVYSAEKCWALLALLPFETKPDYLQGGMQECAKILLPKLRLEQVFFILSRIKKPTDDHFYITLLFCSTNLTTEEISTFLQNTIPLQDPSLKPFFFLFLQELATNRSFRDVVYPWEQIVQMMQPQEIYDFLLSIISKPILPHSFSKECLNSFLSKLTEENLVLLFKNGKLPNYSLFLECCYERFGTELRFSLLELYLSQIQKNISYYNRHDYAKNLPDLSIRVLRFPDLIIFLQNIQKKYSYNLDETMWCILKDSVDRSEKTIFQKHTAKEGLQFLVDLERLSPLRYGIKPDLKSFLNAIISGADVTSIVGSFQEEEISFLLSLLVPQLQHELIIPLLEYILAQESLKKLLKIEFFQFWDQHIEEILDKYIYKAPPLVKTFMETHLPLLLRRYSSYNYKDLTAPRWENITAENVIASLEFHSEAEFHHLLSLLMGYKNDEIFPKWLSLMLNKEPLRKYVTLELIKNRFFSSWSGSNNKFFSFLREVRTYPNLQIFLEGCISKYMERNKGGFRAQEQAQTIIDSIDWKTLTPSTHNKILTLLLPSIQLDNALLLHCLSKVTIDAFATLFSETFFERCFYPERLIANLERRAENVWEGPLILMAYYLSINAKKHLQNLSFSRIPTLPARCLSYGKFIPPAEFPSHLISPTQYIPPGPERENTPFFQFLSHLPKWVSTQWVTFDASDFPQRDPDNRFLLMEDKPKETPETTYIQNQIQKSIESFVHKILTNQRIELASEDPIQRDKDYQKWILKPLFHAMDQIMKEGNKEKAKQILIIIAQSEIHCLTRYKDMAKQIYDFTTDATIIVPSESSDFANELYILAQGIRETCYNQIFTPHTLDQIILVQVDEMGMLAPIYFERQRLMELNNVHVQHQIHRIKSRLGIIRYPLESQEDACTQIDEEKYLEYSHLFYQRYNQLAFFEAVMENLKPGSELEMRLEAYLQSHVPASFDPNGSEVPEDLRPGNEEDPTGAFRRATYVNTFKNLSTAKWEPYKIWKTLLSMGFLS